MNEDLGEINLHKHLITDCAMALRGMAFLHVNSLQTLLDYVHGLVSIINIVWTYNIFNLCQIVDHVQIPN